LIPVGYNDFLTDSSSCKEITRGTLPVGSATAQLCKSPSL
jgi:hypothetical protein